jgi:chromosome segregation ATPase
MFNNYIFLFINIMNPTQITSLINQQKKQIKDLQNSMQQNRKKMEIWISKKDNEIIQLNKQREQNILELEQIKQERDQMKQERDQMKQERDQMKQERDQMKQERDQMKQERDQMKQELEKFKTADQKTIDYMNENNFKYQKQGPFIILS